MNILDFKHQESLKISLCGGKGASLAKMAQGGFPVPQGFIITAKAYSKFISQADKLDLNFDYENLDNLSKQAENIRVYLKNIDLPVELKQEIKEFLVKLGDNKAYSVRSSSTLEDLANSAFAGAHDTFLNVKGYQDICNKIKDCFISLWQTRAIAYRNKQGFKQEKADMAVVVQEMVFAEKAGVSFAVNPISGDFSEVLINANYGLGESVVCGEYNVDEYHINKDNFNLISSNIATKDKGIFWTDKGTTEQEIAENLQNSPSLSEQELVEITKLNIATSDYYGLPQDIEWAIAKNKVYLLQSRPITTIQPHYTRDESAERYPSVITPLTWDYVDKAFHISLKYSFELMGMPSFSGKWFAMFDNYIYGDQNAVNLYMKTANQLKIKTLQDLEKVLPLLKNKFAYAYKLPATWNINLSNFLLAIGALQGEDLTKQSEEEIFNFIEKLVAVGTEYFKPNIAISISQFMLYKFFIELLKLIDKEKANFWFNALTTAQTKTSLVNEEMLNLAQKIYNNPKLNEVVINNNSKTIIENNLLAEFADFQKDFNKFIKAHGHREVEFDSYIPTWCEAPNIVLDNIRNILTNFQPPKQDKFLEILQNRTNTLNEILSLVPKNLKGFILEFADLIHTYTLLDDEEHYQTTRISPVLRKGVRALGEKLVAKDIIKEPYDLFFAHIETLKDAVISKNYLKLQQEIIANKEAYLKNMNLTPKWDLNEEDKAEIELNGSELKGLPASMGIAEGEVFIVKNSDDFAKFVKNSILVAKTTNPAWTPLFYSAKALITESGGVLSHGAVTAREMKIPAVMAVRNVMQILKNGQKVRVNGTKGIVEILDN